MTSLDASVVPSVTGSPSPARVARATPFDDTSLRLLDLLQDHYPLVERPYAALGEQLGISEEETIARLQEARAAGVIRQVCAIYDTKALGYSSALVAMQVAPEQLRRAAHVINAHPGVSHNYKRNHDFNMWFTVAMPPGHDLDAVIQRLHELAGADSTRPMPTLHLFKIAVTLDMTGERALDARGAPEYTQERRVEAARHVIDDGDVAYIRATQGDLPDVAEPFAGVAQELGCSVDEVLEHARRLTASGHLRRFAGILNHRTAGFRANGMAVWDVPPERIQEFGKFVAGYRNVSHCYQRPTYPDWPYSVFSMLHHPKAAGVEETAAAIARDTGIADYRILYSTTEFKKIRLPYFIPAYEQWESLCSAAAEEPLS
ncbi:MAG: AsnC family transcriptional regulator [Dehalococcoidia bacterium]